MEKKDIRTIGIIGGTGNEGRGLGYRWSKAGYKIILGSRDIEKACAACDELRERLGSKGDIIGMVNADAAKNGDIVVLSVPYAAQQAVLLEVKPFLEGKILIDVIVPLVPPKVTRVQMPPAGSAAVEAQNLLGEKVRIVSAFQNISYENLLSDGDIGCDVLVCGDDPIAKAVVLELVQDASLTGWDAGPLDNSMVVEGLTSILIGINKKHKVHSSGIKITGVH